MEGPLLVLLGVIIGYGVAYLLWGRAESKFRALQEQRNQESWERWSAIADKIEQEKQ